MRIVFVAAAAIIAITVSVVHAQAPAPGQASGTLTIGTKVIKLTNAASMPGKDDKTRTILLITDMAVPADVLSGKSSIQMSQMMSKTPFSGLELTFDAKQQLLSINVRDKDDMTATSGLFDIKFDAGKTLLSGTIASNAEAAKLKTPIKLEAKFNAVK